MLRTLKELELALVDFPVTAPALAELLKIVEGGEVDTTRARDIFQQMVEQGSSIEQAMSALGIDKVSGDELVELCRELLQANPKIVADVQGGKQQAIGALIGQARKRNPNANPGRVREICLQLIQQS